jgi:hypothetical protein
MTRLEGIVFMIMFFVLAIITGNMADNSSGWLDWIACVVLSLSCTAYCLYYMLRLFKVRLSL